MAADKRVVVFATGGTIAGVGAAGKSTGYDSGQLGIEDLLNAVPQMADVATIESYQVCNVNSDDISAPIWIDLAKAIQQHAVRPEVDGIVVTHGTDTMDETAYFLNLVVKTDKPVVLTGSMRPSTATSADGPMNLYQAVVCAADRQSYGKGVQVVFSGRIYDARDVQKTSTHSVVSMSSGENGSRGIICDDLVVYTSETTRRHTLGTEFFVEGLTDLPKVSVLYFNVDADPALVRLAAEISDGLVIAGAGAGEFSKAFAEAIDEAKVPVVISSRVGSGVIPRGSKMCRGAVPANDLPPQKAAILLRLALTRTTKLDQIRRMFEVY